MNQGSGFERLARLFLGHLVRRQLAQPFVDERQQLLGGVRIAFFDPIQNLSEFDSSRMNITDLK